MLHQWVRSLVNRLVSSSCVTPEVDLRASTENKGSSVVIKKCPTDRCTWAVSKINKLTEVVYIVVCIPPTLHLLASLASWPLALADEGFRC